MSVAVSLRLPNDILHELDALGAQTERSRSFHVRKAIEHYLAKEADYQIALDRLHDKDDPILTGDEARAELGF